MMAMPNFTPLPSRTKPDPGDDCRAAGARALIGEKSQGDNPAILGSTTSGATGRLAALTFRGQPFALKGHRRIRCSLSRPGLSPGCLVRSHALLGKFHCLPECREVEKLGIPCISPDLTSPSL